MVRDTISEISSSEGYDLVVRIDQEQIDAITEALNPSEQEPIIPEVDNTQALDAIDEVSKAVDKLSEKLGNLELNIDLPEPNGGGSSLNVDTPSQSDTTSSSTPTPVS